MISVPSTAPSRRTPPAITECAVGALITDPAQREAVLGDLAEEFAARCDEQGMAHARRWYRGQAVRSAPSFVSAYWWPAPAARRRRLGALLLSVAGGYLTFQLLHQAAQFAAGLLLASTGHPGVGWAFIACSLAAGAGCAMLGGSVAARALPDAPLAAALTLAVSGGALAVTGMVINGGVAPLWYWGGLQLFLLPLGACAGGVVRAAAGARDAASVRRLLRAVCVLSACTLVAAPARGQSTLSHARSIDTAGIDAYVQPYVRSHNFAGTVLVARGGRIVYERSFGEADRARHVPNTATTRFHVASVSMQFTSAAALRLVDRGALRLDTRVSDLVPGIVGGDAITVRHLLEHRSGLPDINARPDYDSILTHHQTPASLVEAISGQPLLFVPGSTYMHEEHSAYNLLALIIERSTGRPFAEALHTLVFEPLGMTTAVADDDTPTDSPPFARGNQPRGVSDLEGAPPIHWSGKAGNASVALSARDYARWADALFHRRFLSDSSRAVVVDTTGPRFGYGWFRGARPRFDQAAYYLSGRSPGFASFVMHLPREDITVVAFSNIYSSATTDLGTDVAAIATGRPYQALALPAQPLGGDALRLAGAHFTFGADFYQPNATLAFEVQDDELFLRWPSGDRSPLIALDREHFIDRAYWQRVRVERDAEGRAIAISYDRFRGAPAAVDPGH